MSIKPTFQKESSSKKKKKSETRENRNFFQIVLNIDRSHDIWYIDRAFVNKQCGY